MKLIDNAPTKNSSLFQQGVSQGYFDIWMNYVNSIFQIISQYVDNNMLSNYYTSIQTIAMQSNTDYATKTNAICYKIVDFARSILDL